MSVDTVIRFGKAKIELKGFDEMFRRLLRVDKNAKDAAKEVFARATHRVFAESQSNVPVDLGNLKNSGRVSKPRESKKGRITASVNYGGAKLKRLAPDEPIIYGIAVHEDPSGPGYKFLERPMTSEKQTVMAELGRAIALRLRG